MNSKSNKLQFHQFLTQAYILTEQVFFPFSSHFQLFFLILGQLQTISYVPFPIIEEHSRGQSNIDYGMKSYLTFFAYFSRPHLLIEDQEQEAYLFILFSLVAIIIFYVYLFLCYPPKLNTLKEHLQSSPFIIQLILRIISVFGQLMNVCLIIPFTEMALRSFQLGFTNQAITHQIFATLTICVYQIYMLLKFWAVDQALYFNNQGFEKIHLTYLDYLIYMLKLTQCFIYIFEQNLVIAIYIHKILLILIAFAFTQNLTEHTPISQLLHIKIILYIQGLSLTIGMMHAFVVTIPTLSQNLSILVFLIFPLTSHILLLKWNYQEGQIWMTDLKNPYHLLFFISIVSRQKQQFPHSLTIKILSEALYFKAHRQKCVKLSCICQKKHQFQDISNVIFLTDEIVRELEGQLIDQLEILSKRKKSPRGKVAFILFYCQSLLAFGFYLQSYKKCCYLQSRIKLAQQQKQQVTTTEFITEYNPINFKLQAQEHKITYFQSQRISLLKDEAHIHLNKQISKENNNSLELASGILSFLNSEEQIQSLQNKLSVILQNKVSFLNQFLIPQTITMQNFFRDCTLLAKQIYNFEKSLMDLYHSFPSKFICQKILGGKLQNFCCFVQSEIFNNLYLSMKVANNSVKPDEKLRKLQHILNIDLLSHKMTFLILSFNETTLEPIIKKSSKNTPEFFLYTKEMFQTNRNIDFLIPQTIRAFHTKMVKQFFLSGRSSFFRQRNTNLGLLNDNFLEPFEFYFEINFLDVDTFSIAAFFQVVEFIYPYLMLDSNLIIGSATKSFFEQLGFSQSEISRINLSDFLFNQNIATLIPDFELRCLSNESSFSINCTNISLRFLKKTMLLNIPQQKSHREIKQQYLEKSSWNKYECNLQVLKRQVDEHSYYILKFENIKILKQKDEPGEYTVKINSEELHKKKMAFIKSQIKLSRDIENNLHENIIIDEPYGDQSNRFEEDKISQLSWRLRTPAEESQSISRRKNRIKQTVGAIQKFIRTSKQFLYSKISQQKYFSNQNLNHNSSSQQSLPPDRRQQISAQFQQFDRQIDKDLQAAFLDQIEAQNKQREQSQVNSITGFQKSDLFRNINLMNKIITSELISHEFKVLSMIFTSFYIINAIYALIVLNNIGPDLSSFLAKTEILEINHYFLEPFEDFLLGYHSLLKYSKNDPNYQLENDFSNTNLNYSYQELKNNFQIRIQAPYFDDIFTQIEIKELKYFPRIEQYNITLKNALHNLLNYEYQFLSFYRQNNMQISDLANETFIVYIIANYMTFSKFFNSLNDLVLAYTLSENDNIVYKWYTLMVPFMLIGTILIVLAWLTYNRHIKKYYSILKLFTYMESYWVERELERLKVLIQYASNDQDAFFKFRFILSSKDQYLQKEIEKKRREANYSNQQKRFFLNQGRISIICSVITFVFLLCIFFGYQIVINASTQTYLGRYKTTIQFFRNFSNLEYLTVSVYNKREILSQMDSFFFFDQNDQQEFITYLEQQLETLNLFQDQLTLFKRQISSQMFFSDQYLVGSLFSSQFQDSVRGNVCKFLPQVKNQHKQYL